MEHVVDGGQTDILVAAAVAGDEVLVEKLVVVLGVAAGQRVELDRVAGGVGLRSMSGRRIVSTPLVSSTGIALWAMSSRK